MHVVLITAGSHGDTRPFAALAKGLQKAGHDVTLAAPTDQEKFIVGHDIPYASLGLDFQALSDSDAVRGATSGSPSAMMQAYRESIDLMGILIDKAGEVALTADTIVYHPKTFVGNHVKEARGTPAFVAMPLPGIAPTKAFPVPVADIPNLGPFNKWTYLANRGGIAPFRKKINQWRHDVLGLGSVGMFADPFKANGRPLPVLYAYSEAIVPSPDDWLDNVYPTGYWLLEGAGDEYEPPADLAAFLEAGEPPVYIGFGSLTGKDPAETTRIVLEAVKIVGGRAVLATGWGGLNPTETGEDIFALESVPHDWLFPRCAAVVHHGGSGTTATGLRAGRPTVICPFFGDQPFWGKRVQALGAGPPPIPQKKLTAEKLASAIREVTTNQSIRDRAAALGQTLRQEDGVTRAVSVIESEANG